MALIVQALTATDAGEVRTLLGTLRDTWGGDASLHESCDPHDPTRHTRDWYGWANALFAEVVPRACHDSR
jgi:meiotically up-regulated gene 157 (Mug157) protein